MSRSLNIFGLIALTLILAAAWIFYFLKEDVPKLYINELMANNLSCCPDTTAGRPEFDDWIEIYNAGRKPVDIGGMYFSQHRDSPLGYRIPNTNSSATTIQPGGFLLVWADGDIDQGELHLEFKLSHRGEFIGLFYNDGRTIDTLTFKQQNENISYGRAADGGNNWKEYALPTPGKSNQ
ncbi:MAG: lamin tail domain-containing protein [Cyclobacteriaceae bacterium]|jgi:hypothetical protein|nr:lamin tail domain-containing protein [Cyclobacteriaceae bacterium]MDH4297087.1 lamin tail domain-containing protein [Cyclobacteriaceae bacterium]MDH5249172.1 lamin tail domain-containing protein [Cyclobacteriaceae bacterium]